MASVLSITVALGSGLPQALLHVPTKEMENGVALPKFPGSSMGRAQGHYLLFHNFVLHEQKSPTGGRVTGNPDNRVVGRWAQQSMVHWVILLQEKLPINSQLYRLILKFLTQSCTDLLLSDASKCSLSQRDPSPTLCFKK